MTRALPKHLRDWRCQECRALTTVLYYRSVPNGDGTISNLPVCYGCWKGGKDSA